MHKQKRKLTTVVVNSGKRVKIRIYNKWFKVHPFRVNFFNNDKEFFCSIYKRNSLTNFTFYFSVT